MRVGREREQGRAPSRRTHGCAKTTPRIRRAIQASEEKNTILAKRYGVHRQTIAKWKARESTSDMRMGPKNPRSSFLTLNSEAIVLAYRWRTRLSLDDSYVRLKRYFTELSRSALYRCLKRHGLSTIGRTAKCSPLTSAALKGPYCFEITVIKVGGPGDVFGETLPVFLAVEKVTKLVYAAFGKATPTNAATFLDHLVAEFPQIINKVATDIAPLFTDWSGTSYGNLAAVSSHPFAIACRANRILHTRTIPPSQECSEPKRRSRAVEFRYVGRSASTPTP
jgi:transposase